MPLPYSGGFETFAGLTFEAFEHLVAGCDWPTTGTTPLPHAAEPEAGRPPNRFLGVY